MKNEINENTGSASGAPNDSSAAAPAQSETHAPDLRASAAAPGSAVRRASDEQLNSSSKYPKHGSEAEKEWTRKQVMAWKEKCAANGRPVPSHEATAQEIVDWIGAPLEAAGWKKLH